MKATKKPKKRARAVRLPIFLTGPEVQAALGGVSHVAVIKLVKSGKLHRVGKARQGQGFLYNESEVTSLAKSYKPQAARGRAVKAHRRKRVDRFAVTQGVPADD